MPIYEYECENKHRFEKWQSMKDDPIKECPECGTSVRKILHPAGIIFKGSGWYITDSRKSSGSDAKAESKSDKSDTKSEGGETKSEAKSEAKTDAKSESKSEAKSDTSSSKGESKSSSSSE
jgi:putative FmdB family regulatory protein